MLAITENSEGETRRRFQFCIERLQGLGRLFLQLPARSIRSLERGGARAIAPAPCSPASAARRAFLVGASPFRRPIGTGSRKIEILFAFCAFSTLFKAENFPLGRDADAGLTFPSVSRPDAFPPRDMRASAGRCARLFAAI